MKQGKKRFVLATLVLMSVLCVNLLVPQIAEAKTRISRKSVVMIKGNDLYLDLISGSGSEKWSSNNKKVATVNRYGIVKAKKKGKATITAKDGKKKYSCKITVQDPKISDNDITLEQGSDYTLKVTGTTKKIRWYTYDDTYLSVSGGKVTGITQGEGTVYASIGDDERTLSCNVKIVPRKVADSSLEKDVYATEGGLIAIIKNNNSFAVDIKADAIFKDSTGATITHSDASNPEVEAGQSVSLWLYYNTDLGAYSTYDLSITAEGSTKSPEYYKDVSYSVDEDQDKLVVTYKNNGKTTFDFIQVNAVFFDANGKCIGHSEDSVNLKAPGTSVIGDFYYPTDDYSDIIKPASYKIFIVGYEVD